MDAQWVQTYVMIGSTLILLVTLIYLVKQTKHLATSIRSETYRALVQSVAEFNKYMMEHPEIEKQLFSERSFGQVPLEVKRAAQMLFDVWGSLCIQYHDYGAVDKKIWEVWQRWIKVHSEGAVVQQVWEEVKDWYNPYLQEVMSSQITGGEFDNKSVDHS